MGAILDANVAHEVFGGPNRPEAGKQFFDKIKSGEGVLVAGGKLLLELLATSVRKDMDEAFRSGRMKKISDQRVDTLTKDLQDKGEFKSDDPHVLALAQASGARLLYSNDGDLQRDFRNKKFIDQPRGKVYSTKSGGGRFKESHKTLLLKLKNGDFCGTPK